MTEPNYKLQDAEVRRLAEEQLAKKPNSRSAVALRILLKEGFLTSDMLAVLGYKHPPRVIGDVRDLGIPITTTRVKSSDGRTIARYDFGSLKGKVNDRINGRTTLPKAFKLKLTQYYGSSEGITGDQYAPNILQIDHRIPYRVNGDKSTSGQLKLEDFMLLHPSTQRLKSSACEKCPNFITDKRVDVCRSCFWASPLNYEHIQMVVQKKVILDIDEKFRDLHSQLTDEATAEKTSVTKLILKILLAYSVQSKSSGH